MARDVAIYIARDYSCESAKNIGGYFGGISGAAITLKYKSVFNKSCKDNKLKTNINKIKNQILNI
jgi:chromosomal replication initiation ATPase DnaA